MIIDFPKNCSVKVCGNAMMEGKSLLVKKKHPEILSDGFGKSILLSHFIASLFFVFTRLVVKQKKDVPDGLRSIFFVAPPRQQRFMICRCIFLLMNRIDCILLQLTNPSGVGFQFFGAN